MQTSGILRLGALVLAVSLLCSCSGSTQSASENTAVFLPEPIPAETRLLLGNQSAENSHEVTLHFSSENSLSLGSVTRTLQPEAGETLIESVLDEVLSSASLSGSVEAEVLHVESGSGVVTVNLSIEAGVNRGDQDYLLLCASIANTLLDLDGVEAVNVLTGDRSDPVCALPMGVFVETQDNIAALYAQAQTEADRFLSETGGSSIRRNVLLYFPTLDGRFLLPEIRELSFSSDDYLSPILEALSAGPLMRLCGFSAVPGNSELMSGAPEIYVNDAGERIINLNFSAMLTNYLAFAGTEAWQFYGGIVLTLCSFMPEIDAVRFNIEAIPVDDCAMNGRTLHFDGGLMRRRDFAPSIGSSAQLYFASGDEALARIEIPMAQSDSAAPLRLIEAMIDADEVLLGDSASVFPAGITTQDILGVQVEDRIATVNLSANFYARCQGLNAGQERRLIYAMVNSLAELENIGAVSFLVEGSQVDSLAHDIYLRTALFPDPGLVKGVQTGAGEAFF